MGSPLSFQPVFGVAMLVVVAVAAVVLGVFVVRRGGVRSASTWRRVGLLAVLVALCAGPSLPGETREIASNVEVHVAIDRTGSMAAEDWGPNGEPRITGVKQDLLTLADTMAGASFSVTVWDSRAFQALPVTSDQSAFRSFVDTFHQEISSSSQGSSIEHVRLQLQDNLDVAKERRPQNVRYLFILSDGESSNTASQDVSTLWAQFKDDVDGGAVIGYGTEAGGRMKEYVVGGGAGGGGGAGDGSGAGSGDGSTDGSADGGAQPEYIQDPSTGTDAISHINEANLKNVASQLGLDYIHSPNTPAISAKGTELISGAEFLAEERQDVTINRYVLWPLALVGGALLAWEGWYLAGRFATLRRQHAL